MFSSSFLPKIQVSTLHVWHDQFLLSIFVVCKLSNQMAMLKFIHPEKDDCLDIESCFFLGVKTNEMEEKIFKKISTSFMFNTRLY